MVRRVPILPNVDPKIKESLFHPENIDSSQPTDKKVQQWINLLEARLSDLSPTQLLELGYGALYAFLQANITGPPLNWDPSQIILSPFIGSDKRNLVNFQQELVSNLSVDGETIYKLTPHVELFYLAKKTLSYVSKSGLEQLNTLSARIRVNVLHQRLLSENAPSLQQQIYNDLADYKVKALPLSAEILVEEAAIDTLHGRDKEAGENLRRAALRNGFDFALTGRLGKRTKFQQKDLSQLVVLAKSSERPSDGVQREIDTLIGEFGQLKNSKKGADPYKLDLNDDTLLESISFSRKQETGTEPEETLPQSLVDIDPAEQPPLQPLDSIILLATASSVTNTSPQDGLTREETLPYATRVLDSPSTNWQIYTQALIVRSRIEGYRSRTVERGLLQLQAIVDQVVAYTQGASSNGPPSNREKATFGTEAPSAFLPRPKTSESAPAEERLEHIHSLASPTRWDLEAELASRWVSMGGLKTALEIYERLEMWAEVALCWAAQDREDEATKVVKKQLFNGESEKSPLPNDAPRLFCILGDLSKNPEDYDRAWVISGNRYARAQRSLGKLYFAKGNLKEADEAYTKSLKINHLSHATWFALGCVRLRLEDWRGAVDAFGHAVQIEQNDAESWSNIAAALMQLPVETVADDQNGSQENNTGGDESSDPYSQRSLTQRKNTRAAFQSLKRAAVLKRDSHRIWQNLLTVSVQLAPPPYADIVFAQTRLIEILGKSRGEESIDIPIVEALVSYVIRTPDSGALEKAILKLLLETIPPLITTSPKLHRLLAQLHTHLLHPTAALASYEKAWRAVLTYSSTDWESGPPDHVDSWHSVADITIELADAYESFGPRPRERGLGEGEPVEKGWKFKARSALRSVLGRGKAWEEDEQYERLQRRMDDLRSTHSC